MPIATWVAVGLVAVSMIDVLIYVDTGGPSPVQEFLDKIRQARGAEFTMHGDRILKPGESSAASGEKANSVNAASLLARRLATVHHVVLVKA